MKCGASIRHTRENLKDIQKGKTKAGKVLSSQFPGFPNSLVKNFGFRSPKADKVRADTQSLIACSFQ